MGSANKRSTKGKGRGKRSDAPSPARVARQMIEAVGYGATDDPFTAELAAARLAADAYPHYWAEEDREIAARPALAILTLLQQLRDEELLDDGLAVALALGSLDRDDADVREAAEEAARRLRFLRARPPAWSEGSIGRPEFVRAGCARDTWGEVDTFALVFRYELPQDDERAGDVLPEEHVVRFDYDRDAGGELVDAVVTSDGLDRIGDEVSVQEALLHLVDGLEGVDATAGDFLSEDGLDVLALLESRARLLLETVDPESWDERGESPYASALDDLESVDALVEAFVASPEFAEERAADEVAAERIVRFVDGLAAGGVARIGPRLATGALLVALPGRDLDADATATLERSGVATVRGWVRFAARHVGLDPSARGQVLASLDDAEVRAEFARRLADPPLPTLDERLYALLDADGVDATDEAAVAAWYEAFDAMDELARAQRLGPLAED